MKKIVLSFLLIFFFSLNSFAAKRYWVGASGSTWNWNNTAEWSTTSGGAGGASVPGSSDTAYFNGAGHIPLTGSCAINVAASVKRLEITSGYTGTISQTTSTLTVGTGNASLGGGTFSGGSVGITISGSLTISGTAFTSTSGTLTVSGDFVLSSGSFTHNSGTVLFDTPNTITGTISFNHITFNPGSAGSYTISNTITANGTLTLAGTNAITLNTGTIDAKSTITVTNTGTSGGGTATINITGTASPTLTGSGTIGQGNLPKVTINKSSGTLTLSSTISVANDWTWTAGSFSLGSSTVAFVSSLTISGKHTLGNVTFKSNSATTYTINSGDTLTTSGTLTTDGTGALTFNTGVISPTAAVTLSNSGTGGGGTATFCFKNTNNQTLTGNSTIGNGALPKVTINKSSGTLTLASTISVANNWTWTAGTFSLGTSVVAFINSLTITGSHTLGNVTFKSNSLTNYTIANTLTVSGTLTTDGTGALYFITGTIAPTGAVTLNNSGSNGGGSATFSFNNTNNQTLTGNTTVGNGALPKVSINKSSGTLTLVSTISVANDWTWTAGTFSLGSSTVAFVKTLTITGNHTLGNVTFKSDTITAYTVASGNTLTVSGTLTTDGTGALSFNTGTIAPTAAVTLSNSGTGGGGNGTFSFNNTNNQTLTGNSTVGNGALPKVSISKSSGTLTLASTISVANDWTWTVGTFSLGSSVVAFVNSLTITGTHTLGAVTFKSNSTTTYTIASGTTLTVSGTLTTDGSGDLTFSTGTITATGSTVSILNTGTAGGGNATFTFTNTAQTINAPTAPDKGILPNATFTNSSASTYTVTSGDTLTVGGTLTIAGSGSLTFNTGTINAKSTVTVTNSGTAGGGTATLNFVGTASPTFTGSGTAGQGILPKIRIKKSSGTLTLASVISAGSDWTWVAGTVTQGTSTVIFKGTGTITGTQTLNDVTFDNSSSTTYTIASGTTLTVGGTLTISGTGSLTFNTGTINAANAVNISNTGTAGGGTATFTFNGTSQTITPPSNADKGILPNVTFTNSSTSTYTVASGDTLTVAGTLTIAGTGSLTFNTGVIKAEGSITVTNTGTAGGGTATVNIHGTGSQTLTGSGTVGQGILPKVYINKSTGTGTGPLTLSSTISVGNDWAYTSGAFTLGSSTVAFVKSLTISGSHTLGNVTFKSNSLANYTIANTLTVSGTLTTDGTGALYFITGTIAPTGAVTLNNSGTGGGGSATFSFNSTNNQTVTGNSTVGNGALPKVSINKSSGTLTLASTISVANDWTWTAGTFSLGSSTVAFVKSLTITGNHTLGNVTFKSDTTTAYAIASGNTLTVSGTLTTDGIGVLSFNTGTIAPTAAVTLSNSGTGGGGNGTFSFDNTNNQTLTGNATVGNGALPKVYIHKTSGTLTLASTISVANDWTWNTGAFSLGSSTVAFVNSLTISGKHTLGNVTFKSNSATTYTINSGDTLTTSGTLLTDGTGALTFSTGVISPTGAVTLSNSGTGGGGTATIYFNNTNNQTLTGNSTVGNGALPKVKINKSSGTLTLASTISVANDWTWSAGSFSLGTSVVAFINSLTISGSHTLGSVTFKSNSATTYTIANTLTASGTLTMDGTGDLTFNTGTISSTGTTVKVTNSGTGGGGTATFSFSGNDKTMTCPVTGGQGTLPNVTFTDNSTRFNTITTGTILTVAGTLTIAGTGNIYLNSGSIYAKGDITETNTGTNGGGDATIYINGTGTQTLTGQGTAGNGILPSIYINKSSGSLNLSSVISATSNWTYNNGTVTPGASTVWFSFATITGNHALQNVTFRGGGLSTVASGTTLTVNGTLTMGSGADNAGVNTGTIYAKGDIDMSSNTTTSNGGGSATIVINGSGTQHLYGSSTYLSGRICSIQINKSSADTLYISGHVAELFNWTYTAGVVTPGSSTITFIFSSTISGTHTLNNVRFYATAAGRSYNVTGTLTMNGNLVLDGTTAITINTGTINLKGNATVANSASGGGGSATLAFVGTGSQTLTGYGTAGYGALPNVSINKSGTLTLASIITCDGDWTYTAGTVSPTYSSGGSTNNSTVAFTGSHNLASSGMSFANLTVYSGTRTLTSNADANNNLSIESGGTLSAGAYTMNVGGNWSNSGTWTPGTSTVVFDGNGYKGITKSSGTESFYNVTVNRSGQSLSLYSPTTISHAMTLTKGHVKTTSTNYLNFADNATVSGAADSAYVSGPVRKTGNDAFTFPLGDTTLHDTAYHPLAITAPSSTGDQFEATYFAVDQSVGDSLVDSLASISDCEYWNLEKKAGSSNVSASLGWNRNSCGIDDYDDMRIAGWNSVKWIDLGQGSISPAGYTGTISTASTINFGSVSLWHLVIAKKPNAQPYAILKKKLDAGYYQVANGKLMFRFDEEYNDPDAKLSFVIYNDAYETVGGSAYITPGFEKQVYNGTNYYLVNLLDCNVMGLGVLSNGYYILEVINDKSEHWYLRFKHTTTISVICPDVPGGD